MVSYYKGYAVNLNKKEDPDWSKPQPVRAVLVYKDASGKRRQITKTLEGKHRKRAAEGLVAAWCEEMEQRHAEEEAARAVPDAGMTVAAYIDRYLTNLDASGSVEPSTIIGYRTSQNRLAAGLPNVALRDLKPADIQEYETRLLKQGLSANSVGKDHRLLKMVCKHAVAVRDLTWNPCDAVRPPKRPGRTVEALDAEGITILVAALEDSDPTPTATAAALALFAGMRRGEICALRWADVDLDAAEVHVEHAIGRMQGGTYEKVPKTKSSRRTIPLPSQCVRALSRRYDLMRREWSEIRLSLGLTASDAEFRKLFVVGNVAGDYADPIVITRKWAMLAEHLKLRTSAGNNATFHALRHTFATALAAGGADAKSISSTLGHSSVTITFDIYTSPDPQAKRAAANIAERAFTVKREADVVALDPAASE